MRISYSLKAFGIYFFILGSLIWFTLDNAIERINDGMRQSAESVLVDMVNMAAVVIEQELAEQKASNQNGKQKILDTVGVNKLANIFDSLKQRQLAAQIYQITKQAIDSQFYVANQNGFIVYDSSLQHIGEDYSMWRDVKLTLEGKYGARTSYIDQQHTQPEDPKVMVIAAPIHYQGEIIGVVSVLKPINSLEQHLLTESAQLQRYAFALLLLALVIGYLLSIWFTRSLNKIATYAHDMAEGKKVEAPFLQDSRLTDLTESISYLRSQLDGKEYVENYIHSLTHELKTPITSIRGAVELITEHMPEEDRRLFVNNINTSNQRMSRLVDRMLSLAKLESLNELVATSEFNLIPTIERLIRERGPTIDSHHITVIPAKQNNFQCVGDKVLISQAIANLLDNAINFSNSNGEIKIVLETDNVSNMIIYRFSISNEGEPIPEFALNKVYDRFFSLPHTEGTELSAKSTGLGLSFVKEIMKLHHGTVSLENTQQGVIAKLVWPGQ